MSNYLGLFGFRTSPNWRHKKVFADLLSRRSEHIRLAKCLGGLYWHSLNNTVPPRLTNLIGRSQKGRKTCPAYDRASIKTEQFMKWTYRKVKKRHWIPNEARALQFIIKNKRPSRCTECSGEGGSRTILHGAFYWKNLLKYANVTVQSSWHCKTPGGKESNLKPLQM